MPENKFSPIFMAQFVTYKRKPKTYAMKKAIVLMALTIFSISTVKAQEPTFSMGDQVINAGIGIGSTLYAYRTSGIPPISVSFEKAVVDGILENGVIGVGGYLGYSSAKYRYNYLSYHYGWNYTSIIVSALGNFHYPLLDNLDTYAGVLLGYDISTSREFGDYTGENYHDAHGGIVFSTYLGARYYFNDTFAAFGQLGYGIAYLTLGVSMKF